MGAFMHVQNVHELGWSGSPEQLVDMLAPDPLAPPVALVRSPPLPQPSAIVNAIAMLLILAAFILGVLRLSLDEARAVPCFSGASP
jgi:hypothetical protein